VAGCCECGNELSGSGATGLVIWWQWWMKYFELWLLNLEQDSATILSPGVS
jgi:hypothetical protein